MSHRIVTHEHQPVREDKESRKSDPRFFDYVDALRTGNVVECERLRIEVADDIELITKFDTAERTLIGHIHRYIREVQITRRERDAHIKICEGHIKNSQRLINVGVKMREQAEAAWEELGESCIDGGFGAV
jgi:hypothetical protein